MDLGALGVDVTDGLGLADGLGGVEGGQLVLVDRRAAQEAGLLVGMVENHVEGQHANLVAMANEGEEQAIGQVETGPVEATGTPGSQLLHVRRSEVAALQGRLQLLVGRLDLSGVEIAVLQYPHATPPPGSSPLRRPGSGATGKHYTA